MAVPTRIELAISCVTGRHVNRYTTGPFSLFFFKMVTRTGFEPVYACVKGMCVKPLHQRAITLMAPQLGLEPRTP